MKLVQGQIDFADSDRREVNSKWRPPEVGIFSGLPITGDELKEQGMQATLSKKPSQIYRDRLTEALKVFPVRSRISADQLTGIVGRPPEGVHPSAVGAIINGMAKRGLIRKTGKPIKTARKERHSGENAEWEVVKYS